MSVIKTYDADQRGKLVVVTEDQIAPVFKKTDATFIQTGEVISGPDVKKDTNVGSATGYFYADEKTSYIEVLRVGSVGLFGIPSVSLIYLLKGTETVKANPDQQEGGDESVPTSDKPTTTTGDTPVVSDKPGPGRIPVVGSDGKTVYVLLPATDTTPTTPTPDTTKKWLTYGLYGVLGLGLITLIVILVISLSKKKKP